MADRWFYGHAGERLGPFSGRQLHDLASTGEILLTDTVWKEGVERGVVATRVRNLFDEVAAESAAVAAGNPRVSPASSRSTETAAAVPINAVTATPAEIKPVLAESSGDTGVAETPPGLVPPIPDTIELEPEGQGPPSPSRPAAPSKPVKKGRAVAVKGAVIVSQDGTNAKYKQKCSVCSHENSTWHTLRIAAGMVRTVFYCPKCSKKRDVEIRCSMQ